MILHKFQLVRQFHLNQCITAIKADSVVLDVMQMSHSQQLEFVKPEGLFFQAKLLG
jgi:hypothetical protein